MNKELEIRAAKALGWKYIPKNVDEPFNDYWENTEKEMSIVLMFTTSYDWSMLGAKESNAPLVISCIGNFSVECTSTGKVYLADNYEDLPAKITLAWVEALEQSK